MRRIAFVSSLALVATFAFAGLASAGGYQPSQHIVDVTKIVKNAPDEGATFVVDVCGHTLNFNENGGTQSVTIGDYHDGDQSCVVGESDPGGATGVIVDGSPCEFTGRHGYESATDETQKYPDQHCAVTITNTFEDTEETTTTTAPEVVVAPPDVIVVPVPIVAEPRTTG